jgi:CRISPR-associated protein Cmr6
VLRRAAEELVKGEWGDACGWDKTGIDILFGLETEPDAQATHTRGALSFWDLFFQPPATRPRCSPSKS